ncbi:MAG: hypothetical protein Q8K75_07495 [Chlamydiales bacterium]|nr:hypothetical protein [Chlamydiales bacterium]
MFLRALATSMLLTTGLFADAGDIVILDSCPVDNAYSALAATRTHTQVRFKTNDLKSLQLGERLKFWLQWSRDSHDPWKTRSKGEVDVRAQRNYSKKNQHELFHTRGYIKKDPENDDVVTIEMGPLIPIRWDKEELPYFRVAQAVRKEGTNWSRERKKLVKPELNNGGYSLPFQIDLNIVYVYKPESNGKDVTPRTLDTTEIFAEDPGPWTHPSFVNGPLPYVSFFIALGGTNIGSILPGQSFHLVGPAGDIDFWACHERPHGYREDPSDARNFDTNWWGAAPIRVPMPAPGESTEVVISSEFRDKHFQKKFTIHGFKATPERLAERKINEMRYRHLVARADPNYPIPDVTPEALSLAKVAAKDDYQKALELYRADGPDYVDAVTDAYIGLMELQQKEFLNNRCHIEVKSEGCHRLEGLTATLHDLLAAAAVASDLQDWDGMYTQLKAFRKYLDKGVAVQVIKEEVIAHYLIELFPTRSYEPFATGHQTASYLQLLKTWAWTQSNPEAYQEAIDLKKKYVENSSGHIHNMQSRVSPQEYRELAQLIMERTSDRDKAEACWRKGDQLILDVDSPFHNSKMNERTLRALRPGWWPE